MLSGDARDVLERVQDRLVRLQAEFENWKKRTAREKADFRKFATEELLLKLLPILDNLERALASVPAEGPCAALHEGVEMTARLFRSTLERAGVTPVQAVGRPFASISGGQPRTVDIERAASTTERACSGIVSDRSRADGPAMLTPATTMPV